MIKKIAWETFKNTGDNNTFMEFKQIENIEKGIEGLEKHSLKSIENGLGDIPLVEKQEKTQKN